MAGLKLMIVEDSQCQAEYLRQLCQEIGISDISLASNGRLALQLLDEQMDSFDVLICDLEMPDVDGIELINLLARQQTRAAVLIVSGREQSLLSAVELMARTEGLQVLGALRKPVDATALGAMLKEFRSVAIHKKAGFSAVQPAVCLQEIQTALTERQFILHYQPKISMPDQLLHGLEGLVRWQHPTRGLIYPGAFISLCEEHGLIDALSFQVIEQALAQLQHWNQLGFAPKVSVNLSGRSFTHPSFTSQVMDLLRQTSIRPSDLIFEMTETQVISNLGNALAFLSRLRLQGFGLSIDDYGTGYSSVKQLSQLPFSELKMDRSLVHEIAGKPHLQVIFDSTLSMCRKLGIEVVAEGVERASDWEWLRQAGCPVAQGYFTSPPMPAAEVEHWVHAGMPALHQSGVA